MILEVHLYGLEFEEIVSLMASNPGMEEDIITLLYLVTLNIIGSRTVGPVPGPWVREVLYGG